MNTAAIGQPLIRTESIEKVTGRARYTDEQQHASIGTDAVYCCFVPATVPVGVVHRVDVDGALARPGVVAVLWHGNAERLNAIDDGELAVLQTDRVSYRGQIVAAVVATSAEVARDVANTIEVDFGSGVPELPDNDFRVDHPSMFAPEKVNAGFPTDVTVGDPESAFARARHTIESWYTTPPLHNNPMEPHATIARWDEVDGKRTLTVWDSTQAPSGVQGDLAKIFDLPAAQVRVISKNVGGGFGSKGSTRPNAVLAAMAATVVRRPVKLALPRQAMFAVVGYRTPTIQCVRLAADDEGRLVAIMHDTYQQTSHVFEFAEQTAESTRHIYASDNRRTTHRLAVLDVPTPRWMRAPGEAAGMFALETAIDELADAMELDPIELRSRNDTAVDPADGHRFSSRSALECLREGARRFGWAQRSRQPGARREGRILIGMGVALASYPVLVNPSTAQARLEPDGAMVVSLAASDIGTGARTVLRQIAADSLHVDVDRVEVRLGDSSLPTASGAGGSSGTSSWGWAVTKACRGLLDQLGGTVDGAAVPAEGVTVTADTTEDLDNQSELSRHAFGAHFAEVHVDIDTGETRVNRMLGVYGIGRVMNPRLARSQLIGGMMFGLGMALLEEGITDTRFGGFANHDLAGYHLPACADVPEIDAVWVDERDDELNPMGGKGIGEIGIVGTPAAVVNAVYNATGVRVRDLPVRLDKIIDRMDAAFL